LKNYFQFFVGARFFTSVADNRLASFISILAIGGLVLGVAMLITVLSVMNGFEREMRTRILGVIPHIQVYADSGVQQWQSVASGLVAHPEVNTVTPFTQVEGIVNFRNNTQPIQLRGASEQFVGQIPAQFVGGYTDFQALLADEILLSQLLAEKLGATVGQKLTFIAPRGKHSNLSMADGDALPEVRIFEVTELFTTHTILDANLGLISLTAAADMAGLSSVDSGPAVQALRVTVEDIFAARKIAYELLDNLPDSYSFIDWMQTHGNLYQAIQMSRKLVGLLVFLIIGIAAFNVIAMLVMTVINKRSDIAILKTQGASSNHILQVFFIQGALIGMFGCLLGVILGCIGAWYVSDAVVWIEQVLNMQFLNLNIYPIDYVPSDLRARDVIRVVAVALTLNLIATLYPAWRAARVQPAGELRHE
jgi:lipoprotein-releasing system permease protein